MRRFTPEDLDELVALRSDPDVMRYIGEQSREKVAQRLNYYISLYEPHGFGMWGVVDKSNGALIGWCGLIFLDGTPEVEVGYAVAKDYWGRGLVTEAARAALRYGFDSAGLERIVAVTKPEHRASRRIMEKLGMRYEKNVFHYGYDLVYYAITRDEFRADDSFYLLHETE